MRSLMPWTGVSSLRHEMDRMFDRFLEGRWDEFPTLGDWTPHMDISETKDSLVVKVERGEAARERGEGRALPSGGTRLRGLYSERAASASGGCE